MDAHRVIVGGERVSKTMRSKVAKIVRRILSFLELRGATVEISFLPPREIVRLKKTFLNASGGPNVVAFPEKGDFPHPESRGRYLGEIYLNQNLFRGEERHMIFLLIHGILHLLGYDHERRRDILVMERMEKKLMEKVVPAHS